MNSRSPQRSGFTLVELMVASTISAIVVMSLISSFIQQRRAYKSMQMVNEMDQNVRAAMDMISRDVRNAGYGCSFPIGTISSWIDWGPTVTNYMTTTQGASGAPDTLHLVGAFDESFGTLASATANGDITLTLGTGEAANFNTSNKKVIFIGRSETARITSISGSTLTISTDPTASGSGLKYSYSGGSTVELLKVVTYSWADSSSYYPYTKHMRRDENLVTLSDWDKYQIMMAGNIEDFQATPLRNGVALAIRGRTAKPDLNYLNPTYGDRYRRRTLASEIKLRRPD